MPQNTRANIALWRANIDLGIDEIKPRIFVIKNKPGFGERGKWGVANQQV